MVQSRQRRAIRFPLSPRFPREGAAPGNGESDIVSDGPPKTMIFLLGFIFLNSLSPVNCALHKCSNDKWCVELNNCQEWCGKIEQVGSVSGLLDDLGELDVSTEFDCIETRECGPAGGTE